MGLLGSAFVLGGRRVAIAQRLQTYLPPGTTPKLKGPLVFLEYDQEELDLAYDQQAWAPNQGELTKRNAQKSAATLARLGPPRHVRYGSTPIEQLDWYPTRARNSPVQVFIHGGAWRAGTAAAQVYQAEMFVDAGAHFVALDFNNALETRGALTVMADQVRRGIAWVYQHAEEFGADRDRLYLSGQSSGAHLAAVALTTDWRNNFGLPADIVKGALCLSGMYELFPVSLSRRSGYVSFTTSTIESLSPMRHLDAITTPIVVVHGTLETPEFQRQSREFADALRKAGKPDESIVLEGANHFEALESLGNPYGVVGRTILNQMKLAKA
jgi:arylformamidase